MGVEKEDEASGHRSWVVEPREEGRVQGQGACFPSSWVWTLLEVSWNCSMALSGRETWHGHFGVTGQSWIWQNQVPKISSAVEDMEKREPLHTGGRNVN
jgi:hypothetical protein